MALSDFTQIQAFNKDVNDWRNKTRTALVQRVSRYDLRSKLAILEKARDGRKPLTESIRSGSRKDFGQIERVYFSFWLHGWFFDRGVGKGTPISRAGTTARVANPWIDPILEDRVDQLADIITERYADEILNIKLNK